MLMNDIYIAAWVFVAQEFVVEPSFLHGGNLRYLCTKIVSSLSSLWVGSPLRCMAVTCDDGQEILAIFPEGFASFQTPFS